MRRAHRRALSAATAGAVLALSVALAAGLAWRRPSPGAAPAPVSVPVSVPVSAPAAATRAPSAPVGSVSARGSGAGRDRAAFALLLAAPGDPAVALAGFDPAAPRSLDVWQLDDAQRFRRLARVRSQPDGRFVAEGLLASSRGGRLVVSPAGTHPRSTHAAQDGSRALMLAPAAPAAPAAWREGSALVVGLSGRPARLLLADAAGRSVARLELPRAWRPGATWRRDLSALARDPSRDPRAGVPVQAAFADEHGRPSHWTPIPGTPDRSPNPAGAPSPPPSPQEPTP